MNLLCINYFTMLYLYIVFIYGMWPENKVLLLLYYTIYNSSKTTAKSLPLFLKMAMCVSWHPRGVSTVASSAGFKKLVKRVVTVMMPKRRPS